MQAAGVAWLCAPDPCHRACSNLCNGGVNTLLQWDPSAVYRLAALQSTAGLQNMPAVPARSVPLHCNPSRLLIAPAQIAGKALLKRSGRSPDDISSIVLVEEDQSYIKSEAILRIGRRLNVPFQVLGTIGLVGVPGFLRDAAYDAVSMVGHAALFQDLRQSK